ncbi:MAG: ATP-binding protein [Burkholderiaceae bacterium]
MTSETWADPVLSSRLSEFSLAGEGQALEYKREMPSQVRDLAKEIAAFATSNDGYVLIGMADDGELVGLVGVANAKDRDALSQRIVGVCRDIKPPVRPELMWANQDGKVVLAIKVSKGREPLYYVDSRPYIRHASVSRPAEPAEVIDAIRTYLATGGSAEDDSSEISFFTRLASVLAGTLRWGDTEPEMRSLTPWVNEWAEFARQSASVLRDLGAEDKALEKGLEERLEQMAALLDEVAEFRHTLGSGNDFDSVTANACDAAQNLMDSCIRPVPVNASAQGEVQQFILKTARKLADLWRRAAKEPFGGQVERGQQECGQAGRKLMEFSYYCLGFLGDGDLQTLREIGRDLLSLEAERIYMDGGQSQERVIAQGQSSASALANLVTRFAS